MLAGPNRQSVKKWIESLATNTRVVFVLRAVASFTADETATMLALHGGKGAEGWNADAVREIFRQGLCSLASQLIHAVTPLGAQETWYVLDSRNKGTPGKRVSMRYAGPRCSIH